MESDIKKCNIHVLVTHDFNDWRVVAVIDILNQSYHTHLQS